MKNKSLNSPLKLGVSFFSIFVSAGVVHAAQAPEALVQRIDPRTHEVTTYQIETLDPSLRTENLRLLSRADQKAKVGAFMASLEKEKTIPPGFCRQSIPSYNIK